MTQINDRGDWLQAVTTSLQAWRQGDFVLGEQWFVLRYNLQKPITQEAIRDAQEGVDLTEIAVRGLVVVTQTCDIVRSCEDRPFVEVVPLVEVEAASLQEVQRGRRPQYAFIPGAAELSLVADLDRVMTIEKAVVTEWERQVGCISDQDFRNLGQALARKRVRFAFPDDFIEFIKPLQKQLQSKHGKNSPEGEALRSLQEIRVQASPAWDAVSMELMFWFIRNEEDLQFQGTSWNKLLEKWLRLVSAAGRFQRVEGVVTTLEDMTAKEYVQSDRLDLDHLSIQS
ncbi:hypothetical protein ACQ4M3_25620 [Leptolyngbya sp. AN03gr2]|uniref:hypothetical protein n=1 Tax=unclassified Leptolyngbya TaxID=2650499 RepID=UPI003D315266